MTTAERIKAARKEKGLTQQQLGDLLNVTQATVQQYESGKRNPKLDTLQRIAVALDVPVISLLSGAEHTLDDTFLDALEKDVQYVLGDYKSLNAPKVLHDFYHSVNFRYDIIAEFLKELTSATPSEKLKILEYAKFLKTQRPKEGDPNA